MNILVEYLSNLNTCENQWSLWINPENPEEYRIGQNCFEGGGIADNYVNIGNLDKLSFGFQSQSEALKSYLDDHESGVFYKEKLVKFDKRGLLTAYSEGVLDEEFALFLEKEIEDIESTWSKIEAENFVYNTLPEILEAAKQHQAEWANVA